VGFSGNGSCFTFLARRIRGALLSHNFKRLAVGSEVACLPVARSKATNDPVAAVCFRCSRILEQELKERIMLGIKDVNRHPVIHTWSYKLAEAA
jgi:hypothetical protein